MTALLFLSMVFGLIIAIWLKRRYRLKIPVTLDFGLVACAVLFMRFSHDFAGAAKGLIMAQCLIPASYIDAKTHEIPNWVHVILLLDGLIKINVAEAAVGLLIISVPCLLISRLTKGGIGGGDIKLLAACGFVLGAAGIVYGTAVGMTLFCAIHIRSLFKRSKQKPRYPLAPCLSAGCFFVYVFI